MSAAKPDRDSDEAVTVTLEGGGEAGGVGPVSLSSDLVDIHELSAGKLVALLDRRAARDLFDAKRRLAMREVDWRRIKVAMIALGASHRKDWRNASAAEIGADPREMRQKLLICLRRGPSRGGSIEQWIRETGEFFRERLAPLLTYTPGERAFLDGVLDRGEIDASLLDIELEVQTRIAQMPMLLRKCANVRKLHGERG